MSEYEPEPGYAPYGFDPGGADYETVDADQLAAAAAQQAAAQVAAAYEPILQQQQSQVNALSAVAMHEAMNRQQEDQQKFNDRMKEATSRASQQFGGQWSTLSEEMAKRVEQDPAFLPTTAFEGDVQQATDALVHAARLTREDLQREAKAKSDERADDMLNEMRQGIRGSQSLADRGQWRTQTW
jgi:hypothetical protein